MVNRSQIDSMIEARELSIQAKRRQLDLEEAELRGMKALRTQIFRDTSLVGNSDAVILAVPIKKPPRKDGSEVYRGGRQPGAISAPWRRILSDLYWRMAQLTHPGDSFDINDVVAVARSRGINLRPSEAAARMAHYQTFNYISVADRDGKFAVTRSAADKFGFTHSRLLNEAPNAEAPGPHKSELEPDQTGTAEMPEEGVEIYE